jgi:hypothetical protein
MRLLATTSLAGVLVLAAVAPALAACGDRSGDRQAVAAIRAAAGACDCATTAGHGAYVRCVAAVANGAVRDGRLRARCRAAVVRCAARSTCGRSSAVTCCSGGKCSIRAGAAACIAPSGGSACVGDQPSCCDACGSAGCAPATSTTTTTLPAPACQTDTDCDDGNPCTADRCAGGVCQHDCLCVGPGGSVSCCPGPAAECPRPAWYYTCGDPVCGGHRGHPGVPKCSAGETPGAPCSPDGAACDPGSPCNQLLVCASSDPTHGGACPISRGAAKEDIHYLDTEDARRLRDQLMRFRLATFRYKEAAARQHLGFLIDDVAPSPSVDPGRDMVDLYGYTSMVVAALQTQGREIEALKREVASLRHALRDARGRK